MIKAEGDIYMNKNSLIPLLRSDLLSFFDDQQRDFETMMNRFMEGHNLLNEPFPVVPGKVGYPKLDIQQKDDHWLIKATVPGFEKEEIGIEIKKADEFHILTINGRKTAKPEEENGNFFMREIKLSQFSRSIGLPNVTSENIEAELKNGILNVKVPKTPLQKPDIKKIEIK